MDHARQWTTRSDDLLHGFHHRVRLVRLALYFEPYDDHAFLRLHRILAAFRVGCPYDIRQRQGFASRLISPRRRPPEAPGVLITATLSCLMVLASAHPTPSVQNFALPQPWYHPRPTKATGVPSVRSR